MTGITLNLASRPFRNNTIVGSVLVAAAAALIVATVANGYFFLNYGGRYQLLQTEERQHRKRLAALESDERTLSRQVQSRDFRRLSGRGQFAADLILRRSFSWTLLFNKLEDVVPPEVMMTAIRPHITGEKTIIRVDGVAKNHGGLIAFEDALQKNPVFARVYPVYERRVNPSRSEIDFALDFDYIPAKTASEPDAIAAGAAPARTPAPAPAAVQPSPGPTAVAAGPTPAAALLSPAPAAVAAAPTPATGHGTASAAVPEAPRAAEAGKPAPVAPGQVIGTVGRDGRPRTPDLLAKVIAAPGGFYPRPSPSATPGPADASTKKSKGKPRDARPAPAQDAPATAPDHDRAPGTPGAAGVPAETVSGSAPHAAAPSGGASRPSVSAGSPATWQDGASVPGARASLAAGRVPARPARGTGTRGLPPVPATRLDVPLTFLSRPVGDVYAALSQAHGVRIEIDPTVDQRARVTADLAGKNLHDAFASVSKLAGHKVVRVEDGLYRVVPLAGGEPLSDRPVQEESLPGTEVKP